MGNCTIHFLPAMAGDCFVLEQAGQPIHFFVVYRVPYKKNYKEKISSGKHFHDVLCLSEAKGMDIKMK